MIRDLGQRLQCIRNKKGLTIKEFAKELGVSAGHLSQLENGKAKTISFALLEKLQTKYNILPFQMIGEDDQGHRLSLLHKDYKQLVQSNPQAAAYIFSNFELCLSLVQHVKKAVKKQRLSVLCFFCER